MIVIYATLIAGLAGLAFGSFLNVCVSRWPDEDSVIKPASYCPHCKRTLKWWENIPVLSWLVLRGRCRTCGTAIGWRHLIVELAVGGLWSFTVWQTLTLTPMRNFTALSYTDILNGAALLIFEWLLVGLAALDAENLWLPDRLIFPGILLGVLLAFARPALETYYVSGGFDQWKHLTGVSVAQWFLGVVIPTGIMVVIRFGYRVLRNQDGIGAGDVKLIAMLGGWLGGWLGVKAALLAFALGVLLAAAYGLLVIVNPTMRKDDRWQERKLPFGTFLSLGGIVGGLWGVPLVGLYMRLTGM